MPLYFAYGSNMNEAQIRGRCPDARLVGPAVLPGYRLAFTIFSPTRKCGCADVVASPADSVHGLLYELTDEDIASMDRHEGHPVHYRRIPVRITSGREEKEAYTYEVVHKREGLKPSKEYLSLLQNAAEKHDFPSDYRAFLDSFESR